MSTEALTAWADRLRATLKTLENAGQELRSLRGDIPPGGEPSARLEILHRLLSDLQVGTGPDGPAARAERLRQSLQAGARLVVPTLANLLNTAYVQVVQLLDKAECPDIVRTADFGTGAEHFVFVQDG